VSVRELVKQRLLVQGRDFHPCRALDDAVARERLGYHELHEFATAEIAQAVAASGKGVAAVSDDPRFELHPITIEGVEGPLRISLCAARPPDHHGAATIEDIAGRLHQFCITRYGEQSRPPS
jgi:hypothetical protein